MLAGMLKAGGTTEGNKIYFDCPFETCPSCAPAFSMPVQESQVKSLKDRLRREIYIHVKLQ